MTGEDYDSYEEEREYYAELGASGDQSSRSSERDEIDWVEWQARMGTVRRRMPRSLVRKKVQELYTHCRSENRMMSEKDITALVINDLALTFHVSKEMAKIRMIEVGYEDATAGCQFDGKGHHCEQSGLSMDTACQSGWNTQRAENRGRQTKDIPHHTGACG